MRNGARSIRKGFTLFELLVTMAVIAIVGGISIIGLKGGESRALNASRSQVHAMLRATRGEAALNGVDARLIINFDATDPERFLRYFGIVVRENLGSTNWVAVHRGMYLPEGIYFVPQSKVTFSNWAPGLVDSDRKSEYFITGEANQGIANLKYPSTVAEVENGTGAVPWIAYAYLPSGKMAEVRDAAMVGTNASGLHIALAAGKWDGAGGLVFENSERVTGIGLRKNGNTFAVDDPNAL